MNISDKKLMILGILILMITIIIVKNLNGVSDVDNRVITQMISENCNAQQSACTVKLDDFKLNVSFEKNIYYLKPFTVSVWTENDFPLESVYINFKMKNMNMGVNRFKLKSGAAINNRHHWQGTALLPVCVSGRADWFSELDVVTKKGRYRLIFPLLVEQVTN